MMKINKDSFFKISFPAQTILHLLIFFFFFFQIAKEADFFSFGTNDLTQMTFGYSRDDVAKFLPIYISKGILQNDPFEVIHHFNSIYFQICSLINLKSDQINEIHSFIFSFLISKVSANSLKLLPKKAVELNLA